jgi:hypothetical protein
VGARRSESSASLATRRSESQPADRQCRQPKRFGSCGPSWPARSAWVSTPPLPATRLPSTRTASLDRSRHGDKVARKPYRNPPWRSAAAPVGRGAFVKTVRNVFMVVALRLGSPVRPEPGAALAPPPCDSAPGGHARRRGGRDTDLSPVRLDRAFADLALIGLSRGSIHVADAASRRPPAPSLVRAVAVAAEDRLTPFNRQFRRVISFR